MTPHWGEAAWACAGGWKVPARDSQAHLHALHELWLPAPWAGVDSLIVAVTPGEAWLGGANSLIWTWVVFCYWNHVLDHRSFSISAPGHQARRFWHVVICQPITTWWFGWCVSPPTSQLSLITRVFMGPSDSGPSYCELHAWTDRILIVVRGAMAMISP